MKSGYMARYGGKAKVGKKKAEAFSREPRKFQTRTETSKIMGMGYCPPGMKKGK